MATIIVISVPTIVLFLAVLDALFFERLLVRRRKADQVFFRLEGQRRAEARKAEKSVKRANAELDEMYSLGYKAGAALVEQQFSERMAVMRRREAALRKYLSPEIVRLVNAELSSGNVPVQRPVASNAPEEPDWLRAQFGGAQ